MGVGGNRMATPRWRRREESDGDAKVASAGAGQRVWPRWQPRWARTLMREWEGEVGAGAGPDVQAQAGSGSRGCGVDECDCAQRCRVGASFVRRPKSMNWMLRCGRGHPVRSKLMIRVRAESESRAVIWKAPRVRSGQTRPRWITALLSRTSQGDPVRIALLARSAFRTPGLPRWTSRPGGQQ